MRTLTVTKVMKNLVNDMITQEKSLNALNKALRLKGCKTKTIARERVKTMNRTKLRDILNNNKGAI